jgi:hypothetical protein
MGAAQDDPSLAHHHSVRGKRISDLQVQGWKRSTLLKQERRMQPTTALMEPSGQFCPNLACWARGQRGQGNIRIHCRKRQRYRCRICGQTFSARRDTLFEELRSPGDLIVIVVTLLAFGCPMQVIVQAYGLDERTVAPWRDRAGQQCQRILQALFAHAGLDLHHVQADEIRRNKPAKLPGKGALVRGPRSMARCISFGLKDAFRRKRTEPVLISGYTEEEMACGSASM